MQTHRENEERQRQSNVRRLVPPTGGRRAPAAPLPSPRFRSAVPGARAMRGNGATFQAAESASRRERGDLFLTRSPRSPRSSVPGGPPSTAAAERLRSLEDDGKTKRKDDGSQPLAPSAGGARPFVLSSLRPVVVRRSGGVPPSRTPPWPLEPLPSPRFRSAVLGTRAMRGDGAF